MSTSSGVQHITAHEATDSIDGALALFLGARSLAGMHSMIEQYALSRVAEAYEQMQSGKVRYSVVLTINEGGAE